MSIATTPEPPPTGGRGPSIHDLVIADIEQRKALVRATETVDV